MSKKIFIILPYKESLNPKSSGAVSLYVKDTVKHSKYKKNIKIISSKKNKIKIFRNRNYILDFCFKYKKTKIDIIEIHNRPEYLFYINKYFPNTKVILFFHNDPLTLKSSKTSEEREYLINNTSKLIFISTWVQKRFYSKLKNVDISNSEIIPHGVQKKVGIKLKNKKKNILFVGKLNKSKGYDIFCKAAAMFKKFDPSWNFLSIGNEIRKEIFPINNSVKELGFLENNKVLKYFENSEIAIGNSVWDEPLGRIAIEASSRKCLPIISNVAGLSESKKISYVLKKNNPTEIYNLLKIITFDNKLRQKKQNLFYKNNNFDIKILSKKLDFIRELNLTNSKKKSFSKNKKILHIANFNENSEGRLFYSFAKKLNNGFIKNNHIVEILSDRFSLKSNKSILNPFDNIKKFNKKILNTLKNFSPDILIIGHVFNINQPIFNYCRKNNIKICSWYIDSVSKEFLKGDKLKAFMSNLDEVDKCFITSSPAIFKKNKNFNKLQFIPNPVDSSIDNLKNFKNNSLDLDIFFGISHGQNRGLLKKGKIDERENLIKQLVFELPETKFGLFGHENFEPIWGSNFYYYLSKSKMGLNISRGNYQKLYSSDRISSLVGNGLLVFINENTEFKKIFTNKEIVFFKNKKDLVKKIRFYTLNDKIRSKIAELGYKKYHKYMNNLIVTNYILDCCNLIKFKKPYWHNLI